MMTCRRLGAIVFLLSTTLYLNACGRKSQADKAVSQPQAGKVVRVDWDGGAGDCGLTFTPLAGGAEFTLKTWSLACKEAVVGQSYQLKYDEVRSYAASCQGDVNCKDFQDIKMLVEIIKQ